MAVVYNVAILSFLFFSCINITISCCCFHRSLHLCTRISLILTEQGSRAPRPRTRTASITPTPVNPYGIPSNYYPSYLPLDIYITICSKPIEMPFAVKALDHVVLTCRNINATVKFYNLLGMKHEVFRSSKDGPGVERYGPYKARFSV